MPRAVLGIGRMSRTGTQDEDTGDQFEGPTIDAIRRASKRAGLFPTIDSAP